MNFVINKENNITYINCMINNIFVGQIKFEYYKNSKNFLNEKISDIDISKKSFIYLIYIFIEDNFKSKGIGKKLMLKFLSLKSVSNKNIILQASPFKNGKIKPLNRKSLENFYSNFDFEIIYTSYSSSLMIRKTT